MKLVCFVGYYFFLGVLKTRVLPEIVILEKANGRHIPNLAEFHNLDRTIHLCKDDFIMMVE